MALVFWLATADAVTFLLPQPIKARDPMSHGFEVGRAGARRAPLPPQRDRLVLGDAAGWRAEAVAGCHSRADECRQYSKCPGRLPMDGLKNCVDVGVEGRRYGMALWVADEVELFYFADRRTHN